MWPTAFPQGAGPLLLPGAAGAIDAVIEWSGDASRRDAVAVICHPHPLHGGTMTNKVVTTTAQALREQGCATLRFNFRGVGRSEGGHDEGRGEGDDLTAICAWVRTTRPTAALVLDGFREPGCPWLVIQPDADEVVDPAEVYAWVGQRHPAPTLLRFDGASHFFHGRLLALREAIAQFAGPKLPPPA